MWREVYERLKADLPQAPLYAAFAKFCEQTFTGIDPVALAAITAAVPAVDQALATEPAPFDSPKDWRVVFEHDLGHVAGKTLALLFQALDREDNPSRTAHARLAGRIERKWPDVDLGAEFADMAEGIAALLASAGSDLHTPLGDYERFRLPWCRLLRRLDPDLLGDDLERAAWYANGMFVQSYFYTLRHDPVGWVAFQQYLHRAQLIGQAEILESQAQIRKTLAEMEANLTGVRPLECLLSRAGGAENDPLLPLTQSPTWANIVRRQVIPRTLAAEVKNWWNEDDRKGVRSAVLLAPSGYGKSSLLKSLAYEAHRDGYAVFWADGDRDALNPLDLPSDGRPVALFVDNAARFPFKIWERDYNDWSRTLRIVAAERNSAWHGPGANHDVRKFEVERLDEAEGAALRELLNKILPPHSPWRRLSEAEQTRLLTCPDGSDLLEILVEAETGKKIRDYVHDEVKKILDACTTDELRHTVAHVLACVALHTAMDESVAGAEIEASLRHAGLSVGPRTLGDVMEYTEGLLLRSSDQFHLRHRLFALATLDLRDGLLQRAVRETREAKVEACDEGGLVDLAWSSDMLNATDWTAMIELILARANGPEGILVAAIYGASEMGASGVQVLDQVVLHPQFQPTTLLDGFEYVDFSCVDINYNLEWLVGRSDIDSKILKWVIDGAIERDEEGLSLIAQVVRHGNVPLHALVEATRWAGSMGPEGILALEGIVFHPNTSFDVLMEISQYVISMGKKGVTALKQIIAQSKDTLDTLSEILGSIPGEDFSSEYMPTLECIASHPCMSPDLLEEAAGRAGQAGEIGHSVLKIISIHKNANLEVLERVAFVAFEMGAMGKELYERIVSTPEIADHIRRTGRIWTPLVDVHPIPTRSR